MLVARPPVGHAAVSVSAADRYEILGMIASGGMGVVLHARDRVDGSEIAIKRLLGVVDAHARRRFAREARALTQLRHPGVVRIIEAGEDADGVPFLAMELVPGGSLAGRIERERRLEPDVAVELTIALADALEAAHAKGFLHRDIKPANVLLRADGAPLLTDFGLAGILRGEDRPATGTTTIGIPITIHGAFLGTAGYAAPEQAAGETERIGVAADVYGLGATLYAMLTGVGPYEADSLPTLLRMQLAADVASPSEHEWRIEPWLDAVVLRCLAPAPEDRFDSAAALAEALRGRVPVATPGRRRPRADASGLAIGLTFGLLVGAVAAAVVLAPWSGDADDSSVAPEVRTSLGGTSATETPPIGTPAIGTPAREAGESSPDDSGEEEPSSVPVVDGGADPRRRIDAIIAAGELDAELARLDARIAETGGTPELHFARGYARYRAGDARGALADLELADPADPPRRRVVVVRAAVYSAIGEPEVAIREVERAVEIDPEDASLWSWLGRARLAQDDFVGGADALRRSLALDPEDSEALIGLALLEQVDGDLATSLAFLERACAAAPDDAEAWTLRGQVLMPFGRFVEAIAALDRAVELAPGDRTPRSLRGLARMSSGDHAGAIADLTTAIAIEPDDDDLYEYRGLARAMSGDPAGAIADYDRAIALDPDDPDNWSGRGSAKLKAKDAAGAIEDLDRSLALLPDDVTVLSDRADARIAAGDPEGALVDIRRCLELEPRGQFAPALRRQLAEIEASREAGDPR